MDITRFGSRHAHQHLLFRVPDGQHHAASHGQLIDEHAGNSRRRGGDYDGVEGRVFRPPQGAVAVAQTHVSQPESPQGMPRPLRQVRHPLDAVDPAHQRGEHRGLESRTGTDLQYGVGAARRQERLGHARHRIRLGDGLPMADGQGRFLVGTAGQGLIHKQMAR